MTAKEYLEQAKSLEALIATQRREVEYLEDLRANVAGINYGEYIHNPNRRTEAPFVIIVEKIDAAKRTLEEEVAERIALRSEINSRIEALSSHEEQLVLRLRYLDECKWDEIATALGKHVRTAHRIHRRALQNFSVPD